MEVFNYVLAATLFAACSLGAVLLRIFSVPDFSDRCFSLLDRRSQYFSLQSPHAFFPVVQQ